MVQCFYITYTHPHVYFKQPSDSVKCLVYCILYVNSCHPILVRDDDKVSLHAQDGQILFSIYI